MAMVIIFSSLLGAVLGTRYKVQILFPVTLCGVLAVAVGCLLTGNGVWWSTVIALSSATTLQLGYLVGLGTRFLMAASRLRSLRHQALFARRS